MAGQQMNKALSPGEGGVRPTRIAQKTPHNRNKTQQPACPPPAGVSAGRGWNTRIGQKTR